MTWPVFHAIQFPFPMRSTLLFYHPANGDPFRELVKVPIASSKRNKEMRPCIDPNVKEEPLLQRWIYIDQEKGEEQLRREGTS